MRLQKVTDEIIDVFLECVRAGVSIPTAASCAGIGQSTIYRYLQQGRNGKSKRWRELWERYKKAKSESELTRIKRIAAHAEVHWQADAWYLERVIPHRYGNQAHLLRELKAQVEALTKAIMGQRGEQTPQIAPPGG